MNPWIVLLIVLLIFIIAMGALYFFGNKMQKKRDAQMEDINAAAQTVSMLIIDKKIMKLKDANLPKIVVEQTPKALRRSKVPIVKAKVGPKIMSLICDDRIFDQIPIKAEVKAQVSGIYIVGVKNLRGVSAPAPTKKRGFISKLRKKQSELQLEIDADKKAKATKKNKSK